jgi:hypothetical protein
VGLVAVVQDAPRPFGEVREHVVASLRTTARPSRAPQPLFERLRTETEIDETALAEAALSGGQRSPVR